MYSFKTNSKFFLICILSILMHCYATAQVRVAPLSNVGIGTDNPESCAKLEILSDTSGFLKPRMTTAKRLAITNLKPGLEVYDTQLLATYWWNGFAWVTNGTGSGTGGTIVTAGTGINVSGNGTSTTPYVVSSTYSPSSQTLGNLVTLLHTNETATTEYVNSIAESGALRTFTLPANTYNYILIEAIVRCRNETTTVPLPQFSWKFKRGATILETYLHKILSTTSSNGGTYTSTLSAVIAGGQTASSALTITLTMSNASPTIGGLIESFRVYAISNTTITGQTGPQGPQGPQGVPGQGGVTIAGTGPITVTGAGTISNPYVISNTYVDNDNNASNELQTLTADPLVPGKVSISSGNSVTLNVNDGDYSNTNELQTLEIINTNQLKITNGNTVTLPTASPSPTDLTISGTSSPLILNSSTGTDVSITAGPGIGLTGTPSNVTIRSTFEEVDGSTTNELQTITSNGQPGNITLSNGGGTLNLNVNDADANPSNELQDLELIGNQLKLSQRPGLITLPLIGSGTTNYVPKWTPTGTALGNSQLQDNGTNMYIGSYPEPSTKLTVHSAIGGIRTIISGPNSGGKGGIASEVHGNGTENLGGIYSEVNGSTGGEKNNLVLSTFGEGTEHIKSIYNYNYTYPAFSGTIYAQKLLLFGQGSGQQYGYFYDIYDNGSCPSSVGTYGGLSGSSNGERINYRTINSGTGNGPRKGFETTIYSSGSGFCVGNSIDITGEGTGTKVGYFTTLHSLESSTEQYGTITYLTSGTYDGKKEGQYTEVYSSHAQSHSVHAKLYGGGGGYAGYFEGNLHVTGTITSGSDIKLKDNVSNIPSLTEKFMRLRPVMYDFKQDLGIPLPKGHRMGLIAQELEKEFPELVGNTTVTKERLDVDGKKTINPDIKIDDYKTVNYLELIPVLIKVIQEQQAVIEQQNRDIKNLDERLKKVE